MAVNSKLGQDLAPCQLLLRDLVISAMLDNAVEKLVEVDVGSIDLWFGIEPGAPVCVELSEFGDEVFVLGSPIDEMFRDPVSRRHRDRDTVAVAVTVTVCACKGGGQTSEKCESKSQASPSRCRRV